MLNGFLRYHYISVNVCHMDHSIAVLVGGAYSLRIFNRLIDNMLATLCIRHILHRIIDFGNRHIRLCSQLCIRILCACIFCRLVLVCNLLGLTALRQFSCSSCILSSSSSSGKFFSTSLNIFVTSWSECKASCIAITVFGEYKSIAFTKMSQYSPNDFLVIITFFLHLIDYFCYFLGIELSLIKVKTAVTNSIHCRYWLIIKRIVKKHKFVIVLAFFAFNKERIIGYPEPRVIVS